MKTASRMIFFLFYTGDTCEIDIDECASNPCQHDAECIQGIATFTCNCKPGYTGATCETNIDECEVSWMMASLQNQVLMYIWSENCILSWKTSAVVFRFKHVWFKEDFTLPKMKE